MTDFTAYSIFILSSPGEGDGGGPLLSQYVLCSLRISLLQTELGTLLADTVTAVFVSAADRGLGFGWLRLVASNLGPPVPSYPFLGEVPY